MMAIQWSPMIANMQITALPLGLWTPVLEYLPGGTMVRVTAWGMWSCSPQLACGPDGHRASFISAENCLSKDALVGALICKVGGGTADVKGTILPVGSQLVFSVPDSGGSLFMTINDEIEGFDDNSGALTVNVDVRPKDAPARGA